MLKKHKSIVKKTNDFNETIHYLHHDANKPYQPPTNILDFAIEYSFTLTDSNIKDFIFQRHFMHEIKLEDGKYLIPRKNTQNFNDNFNDNHNLRKNEQTESKSSITDSDNGMNSQHSSLSLRSKSNVNKSTNALLAGFSASAKKTKEEKDFLDSFFQYNKDAHRVVPAKPICKPSIRKDFRHRMLTLQEGFQDMTIISSDTHTTAMVLPQFVIDEKKKDDAEAAAAAHRANSKPETNTANDSDNDNDESNEDDDDDDLTMQQKLRIDNQSPTTAVTVTVTPEQATGNITSYTHTPSSSQVTTTRIQTSINSKESAVQTAEPTTERIFTLATNINRTPPSIVASMLILTEVLFSRHLRLRKRLQMIDNFINGDCAVRSKTSVMHTLKEEDDDQELDAIYSSKSAKIAAKKTAPFVPFRFDTIKALKITSSSNGGGGDLKLPSMKVTNERKYPRLTDPRGPIRGRYLGEMSSEFWNSQLRLVELEEDTNTLLQCRWFVDCAISLYESSKIELENREGTKWKPAVGGIITSISAITSRSSKEKNQLINQSIVNQPKSQPKTQNKSQLKKKAATIAIYRLLSAVKVLIKHNYTYNSNDFYKLLETFMTLPDYDSSYAIQVMVIVASNGRIEMWDLQKYLVAKGIWTTVTSHLEDVKMY